MEKSPIQIDDLDPLFEEKLEVFRKALGVDNLLVFTMRNGKSYSRHMGLCPHDIISMCLGLIENATDRLVDKEEETPV